MRITHVSIVHRPTDTRIFRKQCRTLARAGYDVHLVIGGPVAGEIDGVRLHSVAENGHRPPFRLQGARFLRASRWAWRLRPSVYHLHDPHLIPLGLALKLAGAQVVYDVHEDYPAHARSKLVAHPLRARAKARVWRALEWLARRHFDGFVCASSALASKFPPANTTVVGNFPAVREFALAQTDRSPPPYQERSNKLIYVGAIREIRGFWEMMRALEILPDDLDCRLRMIGTFQPPTLAADARKLEAWTSTEFTPWQPHQVVIRELLEAKVGLILLHPLPNHTDPIRSNKLFEYMAAGIPLVAPDLPLWRRIVQGVGCGLVVDPRDPEAIASAIEQLVRYPAEAEAMGQRGRAAVEAHFNWAGDASRLALLYRRLAGDPPALPAAVPA